MMSRKFIARHHFKISISSASTVPLLRNSAIRMPRPTAASATATVITKIAKICLRDVAVMPGERDQVDVHRVEDQFDGHQNDHDVAAGEHAERSDQKERGAEHQVMAGSNLHDRYALFFAMTTEPTMATSSSTEATRMAGGSRGTATPR